MADAMLVLPASHAASLAPKLAEALDGWAQWALPAAAGKATVRLTQAQQYGAARTILKALLPTPHANKHLYFDADLVSRVFPALGSAGVTVLADALFETTNGPDGDRALAYSTMWRPKIDSSRDSDVRTKIVSALRDAATAVAKVDGASPVITVLDRYQPAIFKRLSLYLLCESPDPTLVAEALTSRTVFDSDEVSREYRQLLRNQYSSMASAPKDVVLSFIGEGPGHEMPPDANDRWRLQYWALLDDDLPGEQQMQMEALVDRYGPVTDTDNDDFEFAEWTGPTSPIDADGLASMADDELVEFLWTWEPVGAWRTPTVDGLCKELESAVITDPARFGQLLPHLLGPRLSPAYVFALLDGLNHVVKANPHADTVTLPWTPVLNFGQDLTDAVSAPTDPVSGFGADWSWRQCRQKLAELLSDAMRRGRVDPHHAEQVFAIASLLAEDRVPYDTVNPKDWLNDPFAEALNTVRGQAMIAIMEYARWTHRPGTGLDSRTEVLLERHLNPAIAPSHGVRAVYGSYFDVLTAIAPKWAGAHVESIFGHDDSDSRGATAFRAFLRHNLPTKTTYPLLQDVYLQAVRALSEVVEDTDREAQHDVDKLVEHMAVLVGSGAIDRNSRLLTAFYHPTTPSWLRARLLNVCGQAVTNADDPPADTLNRLRALWEWRRDEATSSTTEASELSGFGEWFLSTHYPSDWLLEQLRIILTAGACPEPSHVVAEHLAELRINFLSTVVECLALLIDAPTDQWFMTAAREPIRTILTEGLSAQDVDVRRRAAEIVNRLVARGYVMFGELLAEASPLHTL